MTAPTITLTIQEYNDLQATLHESERRRLELEAQLAAVQDGRAVLQAARVWKAALTIVQFAVANLPPETSPGWPWKELDALAAHLQPDLAGVFQEFAAIAAGYEEERSRRPKKILPATKDDFGPKTAEAAIMHAVKTGDVEPLRDLLVPKPDGQ